VHSNRVETHVRAEEDHAGDAGVSASALHSGEAGVVVVTMVAHGGYKEATREG
jgi:hypothetical protein